MGNKKLKIALIGGGVNSSIGAAHITALNSTNNWEFVCGVFGKSKNQPLTFINSRSLKIYSSIKDLIKLEKENIDCFLLLTPPKENKEIINLIKKTKLPIISEKPIFNNLKDLDKLRNYIKKNKIKFLTTYNYSYYPALKELKYLIQKEKSKLNKIIIEMPQQGFFLKNTIIKNWRKNDKFIPNLFLDLGSHLYNLSYYLLNSYPSEILCKANSKKKILVDSNIWCKFKNGSDGVFWISKNAGGHENDLKIEILFETKSYLWEHTNPDAIVISYNNGSKTLINRSKSGLKYLNNSRFNVYKPGHPTGFLETFVNLYNEIYKKIVNEKDKINENNFNFEHSYKIVKILDRMKKSLTQKKWIKTDVE
jgi:predicted dehydrogenase